MKDLQNIKNCFLFSQLKDKDLAVVNKYIGLKEYRKNSLIFLEGESAASLYIVKKGLVNLIKTSPDGREKLIRIVKPNEQFAEAAVFSGGVYPVTAISKKDSILSFLKREMLIKLLGDYPDIALGMMSAMSDLLRYLSGLVSNLQLKSVKARLAEYIIEKYNLTGSSRFSLGCKKQDLAFQLGTTKETLSRILKKIVDEGVIDVEKNYIVIKNLSSLKNSGSLNL